MWNKQQRLWPITGCLVSAVVIASSSAAQVQAQYTLAPLLEEPISIIQQLSIELIDARARVLRQTPDALQQLSDEIRDDLARVSSTLRTRHPAQTAQLTGAVAGLLGANSDDQIESTATALIQAVDSVKEITNDAATNAAVAALLLVSESGLAEAFEEAVAGDDNADDDNEDEQNSAVQETDKDNINIPYQLAYQLLQLVHERLGNLPAKESAAGDPISDPASDVQELLNRLDELLPTAQVTDTLSVDPEAAEEIAQALVGVLERQLQADLYFDRDLQKALAIVAGMIAQACGLPPGHDRETVLISQFHFENSLAATLSVLATETAEAIEDTYADIITQGSMAAAQCDALTDHYAAVAQLLFPGSVQQLSGQKQ